MGGVNEQSQLASGEGLIAASVAALNASRGLKARLRFTDFTLIVFAASWFVTVSSGALIVLKHALVQGQQANAPAHIPDHLSLSHTPGLPTLVMFLHPNCPCSRASMSELNALATACENAAAINVVFVDPAGLVRDSESAELWQSAAHIPGASLIHDSNGVLSRKLGAETSGQVLLYDAVGTLRFNGGVTDSRGHAGNNTGRMAIEAILRNQTPAAPTTPVFGCALW